MWILLNCHFLLLKILANLCVSKEKTLIVIHLIEKYLYFWFDESGWQWLKKLLPPFPKGLTKYNFYTKIKNRKKIVKKFLIYP